MLCRLCGGVFDPEQLIPWEIPSGTTIDVCDCCASDAPGHAALAADLVPIQHHFLFSEVHEILIKFSELNEFTPPTAGEVLDIVNLAWTEERKAMVHEARVDQAMDTIRISKIKLGQNGNGSRSEEE